MAKKYRNTNIGEKDPKAGIVNLWVIFMFSVFPVIFHNFYFDMLITKYMTFVLLTAVMLVSLVFLHFASKSRFDYEAYIQSLEVPDIAMLIFVGSAFFGTIFAVPYVYQAILGYEGRYHGLISFFFYAAIFLWASRYYSFDKKHIHIFLAVGMFLCLFGISDYFNMNLLGFKDNINPRQWSMFTSTIGNINTYTAFVGYYVAVSGILFLMTDSKGHTLKEKFLGEVMFYYIAMAVSFLALTLGISDNGYLILGAFFAFAPIIAFKTFRGIRRYMLTVSTYFTIIKLVDMINKAFPDKVLGVSGLYNYIADFAYLPFILGILWGMTAGIYLYDYKRENREASKIFLVAWFIFLGVTFLGICIMAYMINTDPDITYTRWGGLANYFVFTDKWGTMRGYIWRAALEEYGNLPFYRKLFGTGPETFGIYMVNLRYEEMVSVTGQYFDSAHNEYIQYLFTHGLVGLLSYLTLAISTIVYAIKSLKTVVTENKPYVWALIYLMICYMFQAGVNIALPIVTPVFFIAMMMLRSFSREKNI